MDAFDAVAAARARLEAYGRACAAARPTRAPISYLSAAQLGALYAEGQIVALVAAPGLAGKKDVAPWLQT